MKKIHKISKEGYEHYLLKEIFEQPKIIKKIIKEHLDVRANKIIFPELDGILKKIKKADKIILLGCGSSYYAALLGKYFLEEISGLSAKAELADEFIERKIKLNKKSVIIVLSQSGETTDTILSIKKAKKMGAFIVSLTNNKDTKLSRLSNKILFLKAGHEAAISASKTFMAEILFLNLLAIYFGKDKLSMAAYRRLIKELLNLPTKANKIFKNVLSIQLLAEKYYKRENYLILGKNMCFPIALETALKFKETAYLHAEGLPTGELKHGPIASIDKKTICIFFAPKDNTYKKNEEIIKHIKKLKRKIIVITSSGNRRLLKQADKVIYIPQTLDFFYPILSIIPAQLLSYYLSVARGVRVDRPRYLTKFVI